MNKPKVDTNVLRRAMRLNLETNADIAKLVGIHSSTIISRKINNWNEYRFNYCECKVIAGRYGYKCVEQLLNWYEENYIYS